MRPLTILFVLIIFYNNVKSQLVADTAAYWPIRSGAKSYTYAPSRMGMIVMKTGDTLTGYIKINTRASFYFRVSNKKYIVVNPKKVERIKVENPENNHLFTILQHVGKDPRLLKLIKVKGNVAIYDKTMSPYFEDFNGAGEFNVPTGLLPSLVMIKNNTKTKLFGKMDVIKYGPHLPKLLLQFINSRYQLNFDASHFASNNEMIDFILNKENEK